MIHRLLIAPESEPVTLAQMRQHLGITQATDTSRDSIITGRIISARQWAEKYTRIAFIKQTWTGYAVDFPDGYCLYGEHIGLKSPLLTINSIKYRDSSNAQQTLDPALYQTDPVSAAALPAYQNPWPQVLPFLNSVQIEYDSGFGEDAEDVPEDIKEAIRFIVGQWEMFQSSIEGVMRPFTIPNAAKQLLDSYVDMREWF
jgi:uncharacterized phiE125 gp8 family phage protein